MGPREPKNNIQCHLHKTYWGLTENFLKTIGDFISLIRDFIENLLVTPLRTPLGTPTLDSSGVLCGVTKKKTTLDHEQ